MQGHGVLIVLLVVGKEEELVLLDGASDGAAELLAVEGHSVRPRDQREAVGGIEAAQNGASYVVPFPNRTEVVGGEFSASFAVRHHQSLHSTVSAHEGCRGLRRLRHRLPNMLNRLISTREQYQNETDADASGGEEDIHRERSPSR